MTKFVRAARPLLCGAAALWLAGCGAGSDKFDTAPVTGVVTFNGKPVTGGSVVFAPVAKDAKTVTAGKPGSGEVGSDGKFVVSTYGDKDGAVIGKNRVSYIAPNPTAPAAPTPASGHTAAPKPSEFAGLRPATEEVEIKAGDNKIDIQLIK